MSGQHDIELVRAGQLDRRAAIRGGLHAVAPGLQDAHARARESLIIVHTRTSGRSLPSCDRRNHWRKS